MDVERRAILGGLALGAGALAASRVVAADGDGRAAGGEAAPSSAFVRTIPRKPGAGQAFTASLDAGPIKATSGGWARDLTANQLPIATDIAGAHLFLNPGGVREMHWHASAEWAYVIAGRCQATIVDPDGVMEIVNFGPGDTWSFPAGHAHAIQALGPSPCHAILTFDDGRYGEHGTFGLSDFMSRLDGPMLQATLGVPDSVARRLPEGETYIMQGPVVALDSDRARAETSPAAPRSHRYALAASKPLVETEAGSLRVAPASAFPVSGTMTGFVQTLQPGAVHGPHWHPAGNEWQFLLKGRTRVTIFEAEKRMASAEMAPGDCAYLPRAMGHAVENIGTEACQFVGVHDAASYAECSLSQWLSTVPAHLVAANLGLTEAEVASLPRKPTVFARG
jgi:oxalate decarboxylase